MKKTNLFLGADHAGFGLKEELKKWLDKSGIGYKDLSPVYTDEDDYPEIAFAVAKKVARTKGARGILICGSGVGVAIAANRLKGVRSFDAFDERTVKLAREHNDANVIALSGWHLTATEAQKLLKIFFVTKASTAERHKRRVKQLG
jgi:ribose 5-phosphate isomerase B